MQLPTQDEVHAALRHVYTATATATAVLVVVGLKQGDATAIGTAVHQIGDGISSIIAGVSTLIGIGSAAYAAWTASPLSKLISMKRNPEITAVVAKAGTETATLAKSIPDQKITTTADVTVVPKT